MQNAATNQLVDSIMAAEGKIDDVVTLKDLAYGDHGEFRSRNGGVDQNGEWVDLICTMNLI